MQLACRELSLMLRIIDKIVSFLQRFHLVLCLEGLIWRTFGFELLWDLTRKFEWLLKLRGESNVMDPWCRESIPMRVEMEWFWRLSVEVRICSGIEDHRLWRGKMDRSGSEWGGTGWGGREKWLSAAIMALLFEKEQVQKFTEVKDPLPFRVETCSCSHPTCLSSSEEELTLYKPQWPLG